MRRRGRCNIYIYYHPRSPASPGSALRSPVTPVSVVIQRHEERDVVDPRNVVISRLDTSALSVPSPNLSRSLLQDTDSLNCSLSYDTPELIKYQKYPTVDLITMLSPKRSSTHQGNGAGIQ